jgi:Mg/Co/Ni transporter MgtE
LTGGRFGRSPSSPLWDWRDVEFLRGNPDLGRRGRHYNHRIDRLRPAEIARLTEHLPYLHATELVTMLPPHIAADVLEEMDPDRQLQVYEELDAEQQCRIVELMAADAAADLIGRLDRDDAASLLARLPKAPATRIVELLQYPSDTAGGIMTNEMVVVCEGLTIAEAQAELRNSIRRPDFVYFVYVLDNPRNRRLRGVVTLRDLLEGGSERPLEEVMTQTLITLAPTESAENAARRVVESELLAVPVVDDDGRLLGTVTVDDAVEQIAPSGWRAEAPRLFI